jgi:hypothetical protein
VFSNLLKNCVEIDEKIRKWIDVNQCDDDEKKNEKKKNYKNVFKISFSIIIIKIIIIIIVIIIIIIVEKNKYEDCAHHRINFDCFFICSVEFFDSLSFLKEEDWKKISKFNFEKNLKEEFVCVVCSFAEFFVFENVYFDCEFCDSFLIFFLLFVFKFVTFFVISSTLENFSNENQSSMSFSSTKKSICDREKNRFYLLFFYLRLRQFVDWEFIRFCLFCFWIELLDFLRWVVCFSEFREMWNRSRKKEKVSWWQDCHIKHHVSNFYETNNLSFLSLNKFCITIIKIKEEEEKRKSRFCFEFFAIDFALSCVHVNEIESLRSVVSVIEKVRKYQKISFQKKRKEKMFFEIFNQYRENWSISNESDANLTQEISAKRKLSESTSNERKAAFVVKKIVQIRSSTTISSLQNLQMLLRWLIIMLASEIFKTSFFDEYNITEFLDRYANLCQNYDLEKRKKIRRLSRYCDLINE